MIHPFLPSLEDKPLEELQTTLSTLYKNYSFAQRMNNVMLMNQLRAVIEGYQTEIHKKVDAYLQKQNQSTTVSIESK